MKQALRNMPIWALSWINNITLLKFNVIFLFPILWFLIIFFKGDTIICWWWCPITEAIYFYEPLVPLFKTSIPPSFIMLFYNSYKSKLSLALPITFSLIQRYNVKGNQLTQIWSEFHCVLALFCNTVCSVSWILYATLHIVNRCQCQ